MEWQDATRVTLEVEARVSVDGIVGVLEWLEREGEAFSKVLSDAEGSIIRGLEVVEFAAGIPHLLKGEFT